MSNSLPQTAAELNSLMLAGKDGHIIVFKVFMDESGTHDCSPIVVVAAYIGRSDVWEEWTRRWIEAIAPIKVFHAVDAQNLTGEFKGWTSEEVAEIVIRALPIIRDSKIGAVSVGMDMRAFEEALEGREDLRQEFPSPYAACFQAVVQTILDIAFQGGNSENIAFVHEMNQFRTEAGDAFEWIKNNSARGKNCISLNFEDKSQYPPLQAADILAYETNKRMRNLDGLARRPWNALGADKFMARYGHQNMGEFIARLEAIKAAKTKPD